MPVLETVRETESLLRDFIERVLVRESGIFRLEKSGLSPDRIETLKKRREAEAKRQISGVVEERLLCYADLYDLSTIIDRNWEVFKPVFGDKRTIDVYLKKLIDCRNPEAHARDLQAHQERLVEGIAGEIRGCVSNHLKRFKPGGGSACIVNASDNLGNVYCSGDDPRVHSTREVFPGEEILISAVTDDSDARFRATVLVPSPATTGWTRVGRFRVTIPDEFMGKETVVSIQLQGWSEQHLYDGFDDLVGFVYRVGSYPRPDKSL